MKGFIQLSLMGWIVLIGGTIMLGLGIAVKVQTARLEASEAKHAAFVADVRAKGEEQERKTKEQIAADQKRKEIADAENKRTVDRLNADLARLRLASSRSGVVPTAPAGSRRPDLACYGRSGLDTEVREFYGTATEVLGILGADAVGLNTAKKWAQ